MVLFSFLFLFGFLVVVFFFSYMPLCFVCIPLLAISCIFFSFWIWTQASAKGRINDLKLFFDYHLSESFGMACRR